MKKLVRYLFLSGFLFFVINTTSAQSKGKRKEKTEKRGRTTKNKKTEKHGRKAKNEISGQRERPPNRQQIAKLKKMNGEKKRKSHEKKLRANKEYVKATKQKRKEKSNDED